MNNNLHILIVALITLTLNAFGAAPSKIPTGSIEELRLYVADSAARFEAGTYSASQVQHKDRVSYFEGKIEGASIYGITNSIATQTQFTTAFANPNDYTVFWVDVYNDKNELLFYGSCAKVPIHVGSNQYRFDNASPQLYMVSKIALTGFKGAYNARVLVVDPEDGSTSRSYSLDVDREKGSINFPKALVGKGYVEVYFDDGTSVLYGPDGALSNKNLGTGIITPSVANSFVFNNSTNLVITDIQSWQGQGVNPSIQLRLDKDTVVLIGGKTKEGAWAQGIKFRKAGREHRDDPLQSLSFEQKDGNVAEGAYLVLFKAGDWVMYLTWDPELFREWDEQYTPDDGGGKG